MNLFQALAGIESSNNPYAQAPTPTDSGYAQGLYQITTGTWSQFAPIAGIDLNQYPNALSAPVNVQTQVASVIPMSRWATSTLNQLQAQGFNLNTGSTLGDNVAGNLPVELNPDTSSGLVAGSGATTGATSAYLWNLPQWLQAIGIIQDASNPTIQGSPAQQATGVQPSGILGWVQNFFVRGGLVALGISLIIIAVVVITWQHADKVKPFLKAAL